MIDIQEADDAVRVNIADNGIGMSEEDQWHIFWAIVLREHSHVQEGNGLGLKDAKTIVERLDGTITVEELKRCVFQVVLLQKWITVVHFWKKLTVFC